MRSWGRGRLEVGGGGVDLLPWVGIWGDGMMAWEV